MTDHRLFFATRPPHQTAMRAWRLATELQRDHGGQPIPPERLHVTLALVSRSADPPDPRVIEHAAQAAATLACRPFVGALNRLQQWTPIVLVGDEGVIGFELLHAALARALGREPDPGFVAHMSLVWNADPIAERTVEPFRWTVGDFLLIHSVRGDSRHEVLGRWPLAIPAAD
jgi:2'-5' RNA ligase